MAAPPLATSPFLATRRGRLVLAFLLAVAFLPIFPGNQTLFGEIFDRIGVPIVNLLLGIDAF